MNCISSIPQGLSIQNSEYVSVGKNPQGRSSVHDPSAKQNKHSEVEGWQKAGEKRWKSKISKPGTGSNCSKNGLKISERQNFVFVSRCSPDTEPNEIVDYLKGGVAIYTHQDNYDSFIAMDVNRFSLEQHYEVACAQL